MEARELRVSRGSLVCWYGEDDPDDALTADFSKMFCIEEGKRRKWKGEAVWRMVETSDGLCLWPYQRAELKGRWIYSGCTWSGWELIEKDVARPQRTGWALIGPHDQIYRVARALEDSVSVYLPDDVRLMRVDKSRIVGEITDTRRLCWVPDPDRQYDQKTLKLEPSSEQIIWYILPAAERKALERAANPVKGTWNRVDPALWEREERVDYLQSLQPEEWLEGVFPGSRYRVAVYRDHVVATCSRLGNAMFIFVRDEAEQWKATVQLTKREALEAGAVRITHQGDWQRRLLETLCA